MKLSPALRVVNAVPDAHFWRGISVLSTKNFRLLRPWLAGGLVWLLLSLTVSLEHLRSAQPNHLFELSGLMTILWLEFCFAGMFHALRKSQEHRVVLLLVVSALPPSILLCINLILLQ